MDRGDTCVVQNWSIKTREYIVYFFSNSSLQFRRIFGKRTLSTLRNLKAEEGWGEIDISTKGVVDLPTFTEIE